MVQVNSLPSVPNPANIRSGKVDDYILQDLNSKSSPAEMQSIGGKSIDADAEYFETANLANAKSGQTALTLQNVSMDPFTGKTVKEELLIKTRLQRKGETVYRGLLTTNLGTIVIEPK